MDAAWLSAIATALMVIGAMLGVIWRTGRHEGKLDTLLEQLARITDDHEYRLRQLERGRRAYMTSTALEWRPQPRPRPPDHRRRNRPST